MWRTSLIKFGALRRGHANAFPLAGKKEPQLKPMPLLTTTACTAVTTKTFSIATRTHPYNSLHCPPQSLLLHFHIIVITAHWFSPSTPSHPLATALLLPA